METINNIPAKIQTIINELSEIQAAQILDKMRKGDKVKAAFGSETKELWIFIKGCNDVATRSDIEEFLSAKFENWA